MEKMRDETMRMGNERFPRNMCLMASHADMKGTFLVRPLHEQYNLTLRYEDIIWVDAASNNSYLYLAGSKNAVTVSTCIGNVELFLAQSPYGFCFMRVSRSAIINLHYLKKCTGNMLSLVNGVCLTVGKSYRETFHSYLASLRMLR